MFLFIVGKVVASCFGLLCLYFFLDGLKNPTKYKPSKPPMNDLFILGEFVDYEIPVAHSPQITPYCPTQHPLFMDCVDSLVAIGYKKTEAKKLTMTHLSEGITSVQDFLSVAMRKP